MGVKCIDAMIVTHWDYKGRKTHIVIDKNYRVAVNGEDIVSLDLSPYHNEAIYVKHVTSMFVMVRGVGFRVLFDRNGRIYIRMDPYYTGNVSDLVLYCTLHKWKNWAA